MTVERCLRKARDLFESALLLVDARRIDAAANVFVLAAQEVGKAKLLREANLWATGRDRKRANADAVAH